MPFNLPIFEEMKQLAIRHYAFQQLYFKFETGNIFGPYLFEEHRHSELNMLRDFEGCYRNQQQRNNTMHTHRVAHVFIYSVNSPCDEAGHACGNLLLGLPNHFPVNHRYHLAYSRVWDGLPRNTQIERQQIRQRSLNKLNDFAISPIWTITAET